MLCCAAVPVIGEPRVARRPTEHGSQRGASAAKVGIPLALGAVIALLPVPNGLTPDAWHYFALFVTIIAGIITEPVPPAALGHGWRHRGRGAGPRARNAVAGGAVGARRVREPDRLADLRWLHAHARLRRNGARASASRCSWCALLGNRTLGLGYAVTLADLALAPFTASASARSAGTIYPIIRHIPELYGSRPDDGTARRIGAYLLYTALAASTITSSMFITALAPNTLAISIIEQTIGVRVSWLRGSSALRRSGVTLLVLAPSVLYKLYPPGIREAPEAPRWAVDQLRLMGPMTRQGVDAARARRLRTDAVDWRDAVHRPGADRRPRRADDGRAGRGLVGRRHRARPGVEHADLVRRAGDARGRAWPRPDSSAGRRARWRPSSRVSDSTRPSS